MRKIIASIPNTITLLNLLCGCVASYAAFSGMLHAAFWLIVLAAVFDFLDGFAARLLHAYSPMGKELDSLADMVSFGFAPSAIVFDLMLATAPNENLALLAFVIALFSALRLAKFNIDERQSDSFIGMPTPACALFFASLPYSLEHIVPMLPADSVQTIIFVALSILAVGFSALLVCEIPMFSFKFKNFGLRNNAFRYVFAIFSVIMIVLLKEMALAVVILCYILSSIVLALKNSRN